jgi:hypothetical protein
MAIKRRAAGPQIRPLTMARFPLAATRRWAAPGSRLGTRSPAEADKDPRRSARWPRLASALDLASRRGETRQRRGRSLQARGHRLAAPQVPADAAVGVSDVDWRTYGARRGVADRSRLPMLNCVPMSIRRMAHSSAASPLLGMVQAERAWFPKMGIVTVRNKTHGLGWVGSPSISAAASCRSARDSA